MNWLIFSNFIENLKDKIISIHSNSSVFSNLMSNRHSIAWHYLIENMVIILIATSVVGITSGSHSIGLPLYKLNPMHWAIYIVILFRKPSVISIIVLAFALPFTSFLLTGHPLVFKSLIMGVELSIYGVIFISVIKYLKLTLVFAFAISQVIGRIIYYGLKYILIKVDLIDSNLVSTSIIFQLVVFGILGIVLFLVDKKYLAVKRKD